MNLHKFTRRYRRVQRFWNWFDDLTTACVENAWFMLAVILFSLAGTWAMWGGW